MCFFFFKISKVDVRAVGLSFDLDPLTTLFDVSGSLMLTWRDRRLSWDERAFRMGTVKVDTDKLWTPDAAIFNRFRHTVRIPAQGFSTFWGGPRDPFVRFPYFFLSCDYMTLLSFATHPERLLDSLLGRDP